jgi:hypothetical protein
LLAGASGNGGALFFGIPDGGAQQTGKSPEKARGNGSKEPAGNESRKLLIDIEKRLDLKNSKVTLADFIRLTQLERELEEEEQPREIIVTWKDPAEKRCELK